MAKAHDVAYVIYQVNDLDLMQTFMHDFGLATALKTDDMLYMRAAGPIPYCHVTLRGTENRFVGAGILVNSREDLDELAALPGSSAVEAIEAPGGGWRVRMSTPDGVRIDAVWGQEPAERLTRRQPNPFNSAFVKQRANASLRPVREPGLVERLGHFVLRVSDHDASVAWFKARFGMLPTDLMCVPGNPDQVIGTFLRMDRGQELVDHHSMLVVQAQDLGVHHCSFEMLDLDAVMGAHDYLERKGYRLDVGVGRHLLGSQIFDYWRDPFGFRVEHYTDGDSVNADYVPQKFSGFADETTQWGMDPNKEFFH
ncbi:MAG: VOC family protein [Pusillimonas sp.]